MSDAQPKNEALAKSLEWLALTSLIGIVTTGGILIYSNFSTRVQALEDKAAQVLVDRKDIQDLQSAVDKMSDKLDEVNLSQAQIKAALNIK